MTDHRRTTPDVSAAQFVPTAEQPLTFSDQPDWLTTAIEINVVTARTDDAGDTYVVLQAQLGTVLVPAGDWIIQDRWGAIHAIAAASFATDYELFPSTDAPAEAATDGGTK